MPAEQCIKRQDDVVCQDEEDWTVVSRRKNKVKRATSKDDMFTIFLYNIPDKVRARDMWECVRNTGTVVDIILPMKIDKRNKR